MKLRLQSINNNKIMLYNLYKNTPNLKLLYSYKFKKIKNDKQLYRLTSFFFDQLSFTKKKIQFYFLTVV